MTWSPSYVVLIGAGAGATPRLLGTGFLVACDKVVTAHHVVFDKKEQRFVDDLCIRRDKGSWVRQVKRRWSGDDTVDIAVLDVPVQEGTPMGPLPLFAAQKIRDGTTWGAQGYAKVRDNPPSEAREQVQGKALLCEGFSATLFLDVESNPDIWSGLSGAAVVIDDRVQGVVRGVALNWSEKRITATPTAQFLHHPPFREALGIPCANDQFDARVTRVKQEVSNALRARDGLIDALAVRFECATATLVEKLVGTVAAATLVDIFAAEYSARPLTDEGARDRDAIRSALFSVLPYVASWRDVLASCCAQGDPGPDVIELPYRSDTIAEAVMAGLDGRACHFDHRLGAEPFGIAVVQLPATAQTALFNSGSRLLEGVVQQLMHQLGVGGLDDHERRLRVNAALRRRRGDGGEERLRYYFLVRDQASPDKDGNALWSLALTTLRGGHGIPSLALVRMTGKLTDEEADIEECVAEMLKPKTR